MVEIYFSDCDRVICHLYLDPPLADTSPDRLHFAKFRLTPFTRRHRSLRTAFLVSGVSTFCCTTYNVPVYCCFGFKTGLCLLCTYLLCCVLLIMNGSFHSLTCPPVDIYLIAQPVSVPILQSWYVMRAGSLPEAGMAHVLPYYTYKR